MVTTRGGTETSSPPLARKRAPQEDAASSPEAKRRKPAATKAAAVAEVVIRTKTDPEPELKEPEVSLPVERKHIRFSSTSPPPQAVVSDVLPLKSRIVEEDVEESDDDAAPEDIPQSVAQEQALAKQAVTTKALQQERTTKKLRRRKRDKKLKEQVESSDKRKEKAVAKEEEKEEEEDTEEHLLPSQEEESVQGTKKFSLNNIPALLPDELLATEAPIRPPTPPPTTFQHQQKQKKDPLPFDISTAPLRIPQPKAPKDLTVGALNIRVVAPTNTRLPPKSNKSTMMARTTLLKGRIEIAAKTKGRKKSFMNQSKVERRDVGGFNKSFV
jgi:U3 small nucleolar RNA-associated protein 16